MPRFAKVPLEVICDNRLKPNEFKVLIALLSFADAEGLCFPKRRKISKMTGIPETRITNITTKLQEYGWLKKTGRGGRKRPCNYQIKTVTDFDTVYDKTVTESVRVNDENGDSFEQKTVTESVTPIQQTNNIPIIYHNRPKNNISSKTLTTIRDNGESWKDFIPVSLLFHQQQKRDGLYHKDFKKLTDSTKIVIGGAKVIERLIRIDGEKIEDIQSVLDFILGDTGNESWTGWKPQVVSLASLRSKNRSGNLKYFTIKNSMKFSQRSKRVPAPGDRRQYDGL